MDLRRGGGQVKNCHLLRMMEDASLCSILQHLDLSQCPKITEEIIPVMRARLKGCTVLLPSNLNQNSEIPPQFEV